MPGLKYKNDIHTVHPNIIYINKYPRFSIVLPLRVSLTSLARQQIKYGLKCNLVYEPLTKNISNATINIKLMHNIEILNLVCIVVYFNQVWRLCTISPLGPAFVHSGARIPLLTFLITKLHLKTSRSCWWGKFCLSTSWTHFKNGSTQVAGGFRGN